MWDQLVKEEARELQCVFPTAHHAHSPIHTVAQLQQTMHCHKSIHRRGGGRTGGGGGATPAGGADTVGVPSDAKDARRCACSGAAVPP